MIYFVLTGFVNALTSFLVGIFVISKSQKKVNRLFFLSTMTVSLWSVAYGMWQLADSHEQALFWARALMMGAIFIPFVYLHFNVTFTKSTHYRWTLWVGYGIACLAVILNFTPLFVADVVPKMGFSFWPTPGLFFHPFLLTWVGYMVFQIVLLYRSYIQAQGIYKQQLLYILTGFIIGTIGGSTNYFLWYDIPIPPIGNIAASVYIVMVAYAIVQLRLFDIKIRTQQIVNIIFPILLSVISATFFALALYRFTNIVPPIVGTGSMFVGLFTYEFLRRWVSRSRFSHVLFSRTHKYQEALKALAEDAPTIVDISELSQNIIDTLTEEMKIEKVAVIISPRPYQTDAYELLEHVGFDEEKCEAFIHPDTDMLDAFSGSSMSFVRDELDFEIQVDDTSERQKQKLQTVRDAMQESDASIVLALRVKDTLLGFFVMGNKRRGAYTVEDISLLEDISNQLAVALMHSRMHEEKTVLTRMLREEVAAATNAWKEKSKENEELSNVKSQFIEVASHQLRTPISVIRNSLQMVLDDYLGPENTQADCEQITPLLRNAFLASDNLNNSINSILAAEEFIDKKPYVHVDRVTLKAFLERRVRRAQALIDAKSGEGLQLNTAFADNLPEHIVTDEEKLAMILDQLLMNAVLYTIDGTVSVNAQVQDKHVLFRIQDTGIGIPTAEEDTVFERFVRLKNAQRVVPDGTGLGLYLAQEYSNLLRGKISFTSEEGQGTTFTVSIPLEYNYV